jgi:hypothetical protein
VNNPAYNPGVQILAHGVLGGLVAEARGKDFGSGAAGGMIEAIIGNIIRSEFPSLDANLHTKENYIQQALYQGGAMLASGLLTDAMGGDAVVAANAAQNAAQNNFLSPQDKRRRDELRELAKNGYQGMGLADKQAAAAELLRLEVWDQGSDYYMWRLQNGESLTKGQQRDFDKFVNRYVTGERLVSNATEQEIINKLYATPVVSPADRFYYAGPFEAWDVYMDALTDRDGFFAARIYPGRVVSAEEEQFKDNVLYKSGYLGYSWVEGLMPTRLSWAAFDTRMDFLRTSPVGALAYIAANVAGGSQETQDAVLGMGAAFDGMLMAGGSLAAGRGYSMLPEGLNPLFGGRYIGTPSVTPYATEPWWSESLIGGKASSNSFAALSGEAGLVRSLTTTGYPAYASTSWRGGSADALVAELTALTTPWGSTPVSSVMWTGEVAAKGGGTVADDAFSHGYTYADRVIIRAVQDPVSHNFPYSFDDGILATKPILKANGYNIYQKPGTMNDKTGVFEIGVTKDGVIDHRFFRPDK